MDKEKLMVIDGSSLLYRAFYALPFLTTKEGVYTNGVYGFLTMLYRIKDEYNPDYLCIAFDKKGPTFRHKEYKDYKGTRESAPSELAQQFPIIREILEIMNIKTIEMDEYEADDIAGTLAKIGEENSLDVILVTGDKDYLQLATDDSKILLTRRGITELEIFDRSKIKDEYGIEPHEFVDLKGLMGDKSDNIPGVPGIGEKTGLKLIKEFGSMENIYENLDKVKGKKLKENLIEYENTAYLSRTLGKIITNVPLEVTIEQLKVEEPNWDELLSIYEEFEFTTLIDKIPGKNLTKNEEINQGYKYEILNIEDIDEIISAIKKSKKFAFKFLTEDFNYIESPIIGLGIKLEDKSTYYIDLTKDIDIFVDKFRCIFEDPNIEKIGYNLKTDIVVLLRLKIKLSNFTYDAEIGQYLINPSQNNYSINKLSEEYLNYYGIDEESLLGKGKKQKKFREISEEERANYISFILETIYKIEPMMIEQIQKQNMKRLYYEVELPLVEVLANMEFTGFHIDKEELELLGEKYNQEIDTLTKEIYELAEMEFNINSPKQIGEVLFEKLGLPVIKRTKTGYSTNVEVLEKLLDQHPIIEKILRYRQIVKLKSTYIDGFMDLINTKTNRIHSSFNQTITTTGRISSTEPNLQNIPTRTEDGRKIRKAFIAEAPDYILVDADYSQIELRVLAHITEDQKMIEAFKNGEDIHTKTASEVFDVPMEKVTSSLRSNAKAVNFGIVYGISDYGLSRDLNITRKEAKEYIDNYLDNYKSIKQFMIDIVETGKEKGYVETLLHRRRYIPELKAKNFNIKSFGERIAMNTPIQGSAADIIKVAMVRVYNELKNRKLKSRLILQVHDELIIETHRDEREEVEEMLKDIMENAINLEVPLKVDIQVGDSWYETH
ncbi:DNA polymerase I [Wansuia hejianensis]|uniref:DNA polymerase I n=1 Tax=Wansuia hejianensis TaxID=2763667 RepID=A0A926EYI5_9FIRM|nr:DNA polymerase I [Wansuia hejianensis]MBC8590840.1 DNA polymerase I [Wansuia hejianensis]